MSRQAVPSAGIRLPAGRARWVWVMVALTTATVLVVLSGRADVPLSTDGTMTLGVFAVIATLWLSNAYPPFAVGLLGLGGLIAALSLPWGGTVSLPWERFAGEFVSTPLVMMLAGMSLAAGAEATGVDRVIAARLLGPLTTRPAVLMLVLMLLGAGMSMFVSNTATTVLLLGLVVPLVRHLGEGSPSARVMVLAVALGAAIGGLATPIGTPPNLIAFGLLREHGYAVSFVEWVARGVPLTMVVLLLAWVLLKRMARPGGGAAFADWRSAEASGSPGNGLPTPTISLQGWVWIVVFFATISLWISQPWTGIPIGVSSVLPLAVLPISGVLTGEALRRVDWPTLMLMGSGLCLGLAMAETGLARWMVELAVPAQAPAWVLVGVFAALSTGLSTFMSNTATANLLLPLCLALPRPELIGPCGLAIAFACSLAVALPISTPPMLLATATGLVRPPELLRVGLIIGAVGVVLTTIAVLV